ncbi:hypothetical protein HF086_017435 [Spodoptera exigua]|uniref:Uncharacterized protein n=1 Tax=Spodoptera exigua TaxID=7107 RepID=A0A922SG84_SPOEX|nr:hypothetical protein HF086_017435 [Spodoptera exigua]
MLSGTVVTAISGLVAEVQQQMEASYAQNQQRQEAQDNNARPYTNGTILHNSGPVHIVASEYNEPTKGNLETQKEPSPAPEEPKTVPEQDKEPSPEPEKNETVEEKQQPEKTEEHSESIDKEPAKEESLLQKDSSPEKEPNELIKLVDDVKVERNGDVKHTEEFIKEEAKSSEAQKEKQSTPELLEEAIKDDDEQENASVKVVGMEVRAHPADGGAWRAKRPTETPPIDPGPVRSESHVTVHIETIYVLRPDVLFIFLNF